MGAEDEARGRGEPSPFWGAVEGAPREATKQLSPSALRNIEPILDALRGRLPTEGRALEIASGTGQHAVAVARVFPDLRWTPSDPEPAARASVAAWAAEAALPNLDPPLELDVSASDWATRAPRPLDAILVVNLLHIAPWAATEGLMTGAGRLLRPGAPLIVYGAFRREGRLAESNASFDRSLRERDPRWGVRDLEAVTETAAAQGLTLAETLAMPANNLLLVLRRQGAA